MIRDPRVKIFRRKEGGLIVSLPFHRRCFCSPPRGGRQEIGYKEGRGNKFLLTPPHGGRLSSLESAVHVLVISTHAPAWGATRLLVRRQAYQPISTHAPAWGATAGRAGRAERGGISTHAPARGATGSPRYRSVVRYSFLLTPQNRGRTHRRGPPLAETSVRQP